MTTCSHDQFLSEFREYRHWQEQEFLYLRGRTDQIEKDVKGLQISRAENQGVEKEKAGLTQRQTTVLSAIVGSSFGAIIAGAIRQFWG